MEYINIEKSKYKKEDIEKVSNVIKNGGVVIIPTDTVYGLAADSLNKEAVARIYEIKHRDISKPCNILVSNIEMIRKVTSNISEKEERIIKKFFPGALTIILNKNEIIPNIVTANLDTIGVRMPNNKFMLEVIELIGRPIVATSLNISGEQSLVSLENISSELKGNIDLIVDSGKINNGIASTIIKVENNEIQILRQGPISEKKIKEIC